MEKKIDRIEHQGIVQQVETGRVFVNIMQQSGCASCAVKGACNVSEVENKLVEVRHTGQTYQEGDKVNVFYERALGFKALLWAYVLPFFVLLAVLLIVSAITHNEAMAGLLALFSLVPYYTVLFFFRNRIKREFSFRLEHISA